ncbi:MAG: hypothetical protein SGI90_16565 [Candidatus Eisenbacteria bacterium]|nr:hypothetical protein [Candidatus Eisenbacteria bacterium]
MKNPTATDAFAAAIEAARVDMESIQEMLEDHLSIDPENVHWGHVGDANRLRDELKAIADRLLYRGEYAS